jgi:hypothetical protein
MLGTHGKALTDWQSAWALRARAARLHSICFPRRLWLNLDHRAENHRNLAHSRELLEKRDRKRQPARELSTDRRCYSRSSNLRPNLPQVFGRVSSGFQRADLRKNLVLPCRI